MARQQHTPEEKAKLVLEAIRGERTINEIASDNNIHPNMLSKWKRDAENRLYTLFQDTPPKSGKQRRSKRPKLKNFMPGSASSLLRMSG